MTDAHTPRHAAPAAETTRPAASGVTIGAAQVAAWGFAFLLLRVFAVSGYDWDTAFLVSTTLGMDDGLALMFGSFMSNYLLTAVLLICVVPLLIAAVRWGTSDYQWVFALLMTLGVVILWALTSSYRLWWLPPATLAVFVGLLLVRRLSEKNRARRTVARAMARVGLVVGLATILFAALAQTPWVPHEVIKTTDGTVRGYVLSVDSGYLNVLTEDHEFVIVLSTDVLSRE